MEQIKLKLNDSDNFFVKEAYNVLRTNLQFCGKDVKIIAITSTNENEGKSTISLNVAQSFAELGKRVLFIDADMRKSVIVSRHTNQKNLNGLSEVLSGQCALNECVFKCQVPNLNLLFSGHYPPNPAELLSSKYFAKLLEESRKYYDYVIVDTPPLGRVIDAAAIAAFCDGVAVVINGNLTKCREAKTVVEQLQKSGCTILGAIRNCVTVKSAKYYKKYQK